MGNCFGKRQSQENAKYLMDDSHSSGPAEIHALSKLDSTPPLCVWVARGMPPERPQLSQLNKRIVEESWLYLRGSMIKISIDMFNNLMEAIPPLREVMWNKNSKESREQAMQYHGELVMGSVNKVVMYLDDPQQMESFLHEVGDRHAQLDVRLEYIDCLLPFFIAAMHPNLSEKWASKIEDAWAAFFRRILHFIKEAMVF